MLKERTKKILVAFLISCLLLFLIFLSGRDNILHVFTLNVGQGDSILIKSPQNKYILVDGGPDNSVLSELGEVLPYWQRSIDMVILTHPDSDHITGLIYVLKTYQVDLVLADDSFCISDLCNEWNKVILEKNIPKENVYSGDVYSIEPQLRFEFFWPEADYKSESVNSNSVVFRMTYNDFRMLFTGDLGKEEEKTIIKDDINLESYLLKVGHHGSKNSTSEEFLKSVNPQLAIISVGVDNKFGHPSQETIELLSSKRVKILRTDQMGRIELKSNGRNIYYKLENNSK